MDSRYAQLLLVERLTRILDGEPEEDSGDEDDSGEEEREGGSGDEEEEREGGAEGEGLRSTG